MQDNNNTFNLDWDGGRCGFFIEDPGSPLSMSKNFFGDPSSPLVLPEVAESSQRQIPPALAGELGFTRRIGTPVSGLISMENFNRTPEALLNTLLDGSPCSLSCRDRSLNAPPELVAVNIGELAEAHFGNRRKPLDPGNEISEDPLPFDILRRPPSGGRQAGNSR